MIHITPKHTYSKPKCMLSAEYRLQVRVTTTRRLQKNLPRIQRGTVQMRPFDSLISWPVLRAVNRPAPTLFNFVCPAIFVHLVCSCQALCNFAVTRVTEPTTVDDTRR